MKIKENMSNNKSSSFYYNQISKKGLLENDRKLLLKKFGFKNLQLSQSNLNLDNINTVNYSLIDNSLVSLKKESKKQSKISNLNNSQKNFQIKTKNFIQAINKNICPTPNNNTNIKIVKGKYNQSMATIPLNPKINNKSDSKLIKKKNNISSANVTDTTAQNSIKTNIGLLSNIDLIKPIQKNKSNKSKIKNNIKSKNCSTPNLFDKVENPINLYRENNKVINSNYYHSKTNKKINTKKIINNRNNGEINKYNNIINKEINKTMQNFYLKKNDNKNNLNSVENIRNKINEKEIKNNTENNNSDNTNKESVKDINKIFKDKIQDIDKKNLINDIITNNLEINQNNKINSRNIGQNVNINEQITINIENNIELYQQEEKNQNSKKILIPHTDTMFDKENNIKKNESQKESIKNKESNNNENNIDQNYSNYESEEKVTINNIKDNDYKKYSIFNENECNNNKDSSSIKTHENIYKNLKDMDNKQEEQEFQPELDRQSEQTQTTLDKNYILSKFIKQPIYDISFRFLNEENTKHILPSKKFYFINDIEEETKKMPVISLRKLLNLNNNSLYNLICYSYDNYSSIILINNLVKHKVEKSLKEKFEHAINDFQNKYNKFLKVIDYNFIQKDFLLNHKKNHLLNLEIKCEIITEELNKSYEIGCNYISNKKKYDYLWKFDVQNKKDIKLWICTELNKINNTNKHFTYTSQVSSFGYKDTIKLEFNIFSKGNIIEPNSIEWIEPVISLVPEGIFEKSKFISSYSFDQIRACEVETQILFWKNKLPEDDGGLVQEVKKIYGKFFEIQNIRYDVSKFYFFKIEMQAKKTGCLKQNKFSAFDINIIDKNFSVENEIQCIYLMNSYYFTKKMNIRIGTRVILYIVDMKR